jgi:hypothetical protein
MSEQSIQDEAYTELCAENEELRTLLGDFVRSCEAFKLQGSLMDRARDALKRVKHGGA